MHPVVPRVLAIALCWTGASTAQTAPPAPASAPTDRAQRDAEKVFRMILMHADKPRRAGAREEGKAAAPATPVRSAPAASPAARAAPAPAQAAAPEPAAATAPVDAKAPDAGALAVAAPVVPAASATTAPEPQEEAAPAVPRNTKLELVASVDPEFPARLMRQLGSGSVVVQFDVLPDGSVARTEVLRTSHRGLNAAAEAAVAAWRFKPITHAAPGVVELKFE